MAIPDHPTWSRSDRRMARYVAQPINRFLQVEAAGGVLLLVGTAVALIWANSPWSAGYDQLWHTAVSIEAGPLHISEDLAHWVNDGLMALFFFVVGLEIKRELVTGQLADIRDAALPVLAALGGMVVPALIYFAINAGGPGSHGWGVPMATDIAFAVGILTLLGDRVPASLKVLLLGLAIADDLGAIVVIAVFYTEELSFRWLLGAAVALGLVALMRRVRVWYLPVYVLAGAVVWVCMLESGIHATIAGVAMGFLTPVRPLLQRPQADEIAGRLSADTDVTVDEVQEISFRLRESVSVGERLEAALHPWTSYVIIPIFALANAGIPVSVDSLGDAATSAVTMGVVMGLVVGKLVGISAFSWLAVRLGWARLPDDLAWRHIVGMSGIAGIGFTVAIFVSGLAFTDAAQQDEAKIGVLVASLLATIVGSILVRRAISPSRTGPAVVGG